MELPLRFAPVPYPVWRRRGLEAARPLLDRTTTAGADGHAPDTPAQMAHYLTRWGILPDGMNSVAARDAIAAAHPEVTDAPPATEASTFSGPIRLPAQWEPLEAVAVTWPTLYPSLWRAHAEIVEAVSVVARADVFVSHPVWAAAAWVWLERRGRAHLDRVRFIAVPANDVWVRDYGPLVGFQADGTRAALDAIYDPLPAYPSADDDIVPRRYSALLDIPIRPLELHLEGGNFWSDGQGTVFVTEGLFQRNPDLSRDEVQRRLREAIQFERLLVLPPLWSEETGHVDMVVKLADARTILLNPAPLPANRGRIETARRLLARATNAAGERYRVLDLPALSPYLNWGVFPVWRSYSNSLTVNGRVLVPIFRVPSDSRALAVYQNAMPDYDIIPIDCSRAANGGGAVHCLTRDVPNA